jgi:hypothetical protein
MTFTRSLFTGSAVVALALGSTLGVATMAQAAPSHSDSSASSHSAPAAVDPISVTMNLLVPDAPVQFSVVGNGVDVVVGSGTTDSVGDVSFSFTPSGLPAGYYRLVATTSYGISSNIGFGIH